MEVCIYAVAGIKSWLYEIIKLLVIDFVILFFGDVVLRKHEIESKLTSVSGYIVSNNSIRLSSDNF